MLPVKKPTTTFRTLEEIRLRKEELSDELQKDNTKFTGLWNELFVKRENATRGDYISSLISKSVTAVDIFLVIRKLMTTYGLLSGKKKKKKRL